MAHCAVLPPAVQAGKNIFVQSNKSASTGLSLSELGLSLSEVGPTMVKEC